MFAELALGIDGFGGEVAGPVEVEVLGENTAGEAVYGLGEASRNMTVAEMLADGGAVFRFDQGVVVGLAGAGLGLFDAKFFEELGDLAVDVFGAVVAVEPLDGEGEGFDELLRYGHEKVFADLGHGKDGLELGDLIHRVDQIQPLDAVQVALVHRVDAQIAGLALGGFAPLADLDANRAGFVESAALRPVGLVLA